MHANRAGQPRADGKAQEAVGAQNPHAFVSCLESLCSSLRDQGDQTAALLEATVQLGAMIGGGDQAGARNPVGAGVQGRDAAFGKMPVGPQAGEGTRGVEDAFGRMPVVPQAGGGARGVEDAFGRMPVVPQADQSAPQGGEGGSQAHEGALQAEKVAAAPELEDALRLQGEQFLRAREAENRVRRDRQQLQSLTGLAQCTIDQLRDYVGRHLAGSSDEARARELLADFEMEVNRLQGLTSRLAEVTADVMVRLNAGLEQVGGQTRTMTRGRWAANAYAGGEARKAAGSSFFIDKRE